VNTAETVYVWRSRGESGWYALCTNRDHPKLRTINWEFLGELPAVAEIADLPRDNIRNATAGGWPWQVYKGEGGSYLLG
jgi:hypothetical protein